MLCLTLPDAHRYSRCLRLRWQGGKRDSAGKSPNGYAPVDWEGWRSGASGGAGCIDDFVELFKNSNADAGLGASVFHYGEIAFCDLKRALKNNGIAVRI